jgi:hypothetical protein
LGLQIQESNVHRSHAVIPRSKIRVTATFAKGSLKCCVWP